MARLKPKVGKINNLDDANLVLREIGLLEREIESIDAGAHKRIAEVKSEAAAEGKPLREKITELSTLLGAYAEYNRAELFRDRKSLELSFGSLGYRKSTTIRVRKTTVELLKKLRLRKCIRIKEEADKDAMGALSDDELAQVDAVRKTTDQFFAEANQEAVNKDLLKEQV